MNLNKNNQKIKNSKLFKGLSRKLVLKIHEFVLGIRKEKGFGQRNIAREIKKKFGVNICESTVSGWIHKHNVPYANEKTQFKSKPIPPKKILYNLYMNQNLSASRIAKKFNVSTIIAINWLRNYGIKPRTHTESMNTANIKKELADLRLKKPIKYFKNLTPEKSYLLGVLCGDGYIDEKTVKLEIRKDTEFIKKFSNCLEKVYGIKYKYRYYEKRNSFILAVSSMIIAKDLLGYGNFRTISWNVPNEILNSNNEKIIANYLRGIFDSDGSVGRYSVEIASINYHGLKGISKLLNKLGIENKIRKDKYTRLYVSRKKNLRLFKDIIGFTIRRKMEKLNNRYRGNW